MNHNRIAFNAGRPVVAVVLVGLLASAAPIGPAIAYAVDSVAVGSELDKAKKDLSEISHRLEIASATVEETQYQLDETSSRIESLKIEIGQKEKKIAEQQKVLAINTSASYKGGTPSLLDMVLSSGSFSELTSNIFYANRVASDNAAQIKSVNEALASLKSDRAELDVKERRLDGLLSEQKASREQLVASQTEAQKYVDGLSSELRATLEAERHAEAERQRAEAERLAQQQAQQQQAVPQLPNRHEQQAPSSPSRPQGGSTNTMPQGGGGSLSSIARDTICTAARSQLGVRYQLGACSPGVAMDCSGLTSYAYGQAGISIPHSSRAQYGQVMSRGNLKKNANDLLAGDLVFYQSGGVIYHVGVYIGGGSVCHANGYGSGVVITGVFYDSGFCGGGSPV